MIVLFKNIQKRKILRAKFYFFIGHSLHAGLLERGSGTARDGDVSCEI